MHKNHKAERMTFKTLYLLKIMTTRYPEQTGANLGRFISMHLSNINSSFPSIIAAQY